MYEEIILELMGKIPVLDGLRGWPRIQAEEALNNAIHDAIDVYLEECEMVAMTGGAP